MPSPASPQGDTAPCWQPHFNAKGYRLIGRAIGLKGLNGWITVKTHVCSSSDTDWVGHIRELTWVLPDNQYKKVCVGEAKRVEASEVQIRLNGLKTRNQLIQSHLEKGALWVSESHWPLQTGEFWMSDLIGCEILDENKTPLGVVTEWLTSNGNDFLEIQTLDGISTVTIPFESTFFPLIQPEQKQLTTTLAAFIQSQHQEDLATQAKKSKALRLKKNRPSSSNQQA
ncbi:MAG: ribosome maturation factor RimM [Vampirovibrionales bacterium]